MQETEATMITSRRSNRAWVAAWRSRSISSFRDRVLLDVRVAPRQVRLRLVVVEVADEVLDGVVREEFAELGVELGGERLVVGEDERRALDPLDRPGERRRLAGARRAEQGLVTDASLEAVDELVDRLRLVTGRLERGDKTEVRHALQEYHSAAQTGNGPSMPGKREDDDAVVPQGYLCWDERVIP